MLAISENSKFSKRIFSDAGIPEESMVVVPHGVELEKYRNAQPLKLKTHKTYKILANIAQPHIRKNIPGLLEAYGKAFTKNDDVCLILKIVNKGPKQQFDVSFNEIYSTFKTRFKNHAEIEIITNFITDIESLYKACNIIITMSHAECFWMPGLEAMAAGNMVVAPRYGGQLDYMDDDNSLLIDGKEGRADGKMQYWTQSPYAAIFNPSSDHCATLLKSAVDNYDSLMEKFRPRMESVVNSHSWDIVAGKILELCK
jgi:glycosyltransferase involved in cell wall biosynthesis